MANDLEVAPGELAIQRADVPETLRKYLQQLQLDPSLAALSPDRAWDFVERGLQLETAGKILAGFALIRLRAALSPREISAGLAMRNIPRSTAYHLIEAYEMFASLGNETTVQALGQLGVTKALALRHWAPGEIEAWVDGREVRGLNYERAVEFSSRELEAQQREWRDEHDGKLTAAEKRASTAEARNETLQAQLAYTSDQLKGIAAKQPIPAWARIARAEAVAESEGIALHLDALEQRLSGPDFSGRTNEQGEQLRGMVAGTLYHALHGVILRGQKLLADIHEEYGKEVTGSVEPHHKLTPQEMTAAIEQRARIVNFQDFERQLRAHERSQLTRGRGRPRKAPTPPKGKGGRRA
jgi:hypothetical protein